MAASSNLDEIGIQPFNVPNWRGGINTSLPQNEIDDNQAVDIRNYEYDWDGNLQVRNGVAAFNSTSHTTRVTSLHNYISESGTNLILKTQSNKLFKVNTDGTGETDITSTLTLPTNTFWQWRTFGGIAIGVNQATSGDNPVKVIAAGTAAALGGTPPKAKYIEVWNQRVWVVSATSPNQIRASSLGLPENWTNTGIAGAISIDVDADDGDKITGLVAFRERLFVLKRKRIFVIQKKSPAAPATDPENLEVVLYSGNIGCTSAYTIQPIPNDVLFLSEGGVASLRLAQIVGNFESALISRNVSEISRIKKVSDELSSLVLDDSSQYWLSVPASLSPTTKDVVYVLDYTDLEQGQVRWSRFDGLVAGTAYTSFVSTTSKTYLIAAQKATSDFRVFKYLSKDVSATFSDDGAAYSKVLITKAYDMNNPLVRKHFQRWGFGFELINSPVAIAIKYIFDNRPERNGAYAFNLVGQITGAVWNGFNWGSANWANPTVLFFDIVRSFLTKSFGQKAQTVQFSISNELAGQAFSIKSMWMLYALETELGVSDV